MKTISINPKYFTLNQQLFQSLNKDPFPQQNNSPMSILVKINFGIYTQQQLTKPTSTIFELIQSLRNYYFIPEHIPNSRLIFKNLDKVVIDGDLTVEDCLQRNKQGTYELFIDVKSESQIINESANASSDQTTAKFLEIIIKKLQDSKTQDLIRSKLNRRLPPLIAQKISKIGQIAHASFKDNEFLRASLKDLIISASNEQMETRMEKVYFDFQDFVNRDKMQDVKNIVEIIKNLRNCFDSKNNEVRLLKQNQFEKDSQIEDLLNKLRRQKQNSSDVNSQVTDLKEQNDRLQEKINQLTSQVNKMTSNLTKLKEDLVSAKLKESSLTEQIRQSRAALERQEKSMKIQILNNNIKINELNEIIQQKETLLNLKEMQVKKMKENSVQKKLLSSNQKLSNQNPYPSLNKPKFGQLQHIIIEASIVQDLKKIIETQMKKPISEIYELLSYDRREHLQYSLKQNFQNSIHQKRSLLFVAHSEQGGKLFGAFTQEKYDMFPESYFIPDFDGCSFLFSVIEKQLKHFKIEEGENSLVFDIDSLIFGDNDLILDFERNCCNSKFVEGKSNVFKSNNTDVEYTKFLSDQLIGGKGKSLVNLVHYKIFEIQFRER